MSTTTQIVLLTICLIIIVLLIVFRKTDFVKKYWKYFLILAPAIILLVFKILSVLRQKNVQSDPNAIKDQITNIKDKLNEANTVVQIESSIAKNKNDQKMQELKEVQLIKDDKERRKKLASMIG